MIIDLQLLLAFSVSSKKNHPWCLTAHISFLKDHRKFWAKRIHDKIVSPVPLRSQTAYALQQGCSLTLRKSFSCPDWRSNRIWCVVGSQIGGRHTQPSTAHTSASYAYPSGHHPGDTVNGRHPKQPPGVYKTLQIMWHLPYQLVQDFFRQEYIPILIPLNPITHPVFLRKENSSCTLFTRHSGHSFCLLAPCAAHCPALSTFVEKPFVFLAKTWQWWHYERPKKMQICVSNKKYLSFVGLYFFFRDTQKHITEPGWDAVWLWKEAPLLRCFE